MSPIDQQIYEAVASDWLRRRGYETVWENPTITLLERPRSFLREAVAKTKHNIKSICSQHPLA